MDGKERTVRRRFRCGIPENRMDAVTEEWQGGSKDENYNGNVREVSEKGRIAD